MALYNLYLSDTRRTNQILIFHLVFSLTIQCVCYNPAVKVSELGEFGLIRLLADIVNTSKNVSNASWQRLLIGIGDDAAAWKSDGSVQLATTDSLIQDVHFDLNVVTWKELGWKSIAVNLSDIAAMGGIPHYALVSLALPGTTEADSVSTMYHGMIEAGNKFGVAIAGGNISAADKVMITITITGSMKGKTALVRSAAKAGEHIAVTGYTGLSAAGLRMLKNNLKFDDATTRLFREAHLKPAPRVKEGQILLHCGVKTAIDISDGLLADLTHICEASKVSARIGLDMVPVHEALHAHFKNDCQQMALAGGEDYELLFTATSRTIEKVKQSLSCPVTVIGEIADDKSGQVIVLNAEGETISPQQSGWDHFGSKKELG
jgi:thiamine-monophosphate kinase